jgi:hypothetical protein
LIRNKEAAIRNSELRQNADLTIRAPLQDAGRKAAKVNTEMCGGVSNGDCIMRHLFPISAIVVAVLRGVGTAGAAELPTYELQGIPITPHQISVSEPAYVQEAAPVPTLMLGGMPASPHQIAVLTPRPEMTAKAVAVKPTTIGLAAAQ